MNNLTVIDLFCGAGGFSEGFRQRGFDIIAGYDHWKPAIETYRHNFGEAKGILKDIKDFKESIEEIEKLPDTDIILGSPPCVTFSSSNISGQADKKSGIELTQIFLLIVAVKKWKKNSKLKAWFMENVPSSIKHLGAEYTFEELGLTEWAINNKIGKSKIAIKLKQNQCIINSADYGCAQNRERVIAGEIICKKKLVIPNPSHDQAANNNLSPWIPLKIIRRLPKPNISKSYRKVTDPNYNDISIPLVKLTDHFYDTGLYQCEWKQSKFLKDNHPYMGKMRFPENLNKPSRTITATKIGTSREALIYRSEYNRTGNGEYRTPTVREAASIMGFPISFQFIGGETTKWRLVGNAVCPSVSRSFAAEVLKQLEKPLINIILQKEPVLKENNNLNTFSKKEFGNPPLRNKGSRFRRHPFKDGNITVTLSNYLIDGDNKDTSKWITSVQYGNGDGFPTYYFLDDFYKELEDIIISYKNGNKFIDVINNGFSEKIGSAIQLQQLYEIQKSTNTLYEPTILIEEVANIISSFLNEKDNFIQNSLVVFKSKSKVPMKQLFALYAINKISSIANTKSINHDRAR